MKPIHVKLFSKDASTGFIYNLFPGFFIMFKPEIIHVCNNFNLVIDLLL